MDHQSGKAIFYAEVKDPKYYRGIRLGKQSALWRGLGSFFSIEVIIDDDSMIAFGLILRINRLIETGKGFDYTFADFNKWTKDLGFKSTKIIHLTGSSSAAIANK
jgi:hypothetical protein